MKRAFEREVEWEKNNHVREMPGNSLVVENYRHETPY